ncbi:hypothetical protein PS623_00151 [Pseudomonas fluorescens]|nr:hypothetical protein CXQ80_11745 [Pseudomonas sp. 02C 26]RZI83617.1 MAG: twin-arginine translocation signal domain-containing protein [Pseudomonas sp.]VVM38536.1 hypothetical protein PS623_00151 [Pseudomonas fluorescens]
MGKLEFCSRLSGRRGFLRGCVVLGIGGAMFGVGASAVAKPAEKKAGFVVINGWVLPADYFRDGPA